jgi:hypothetical protein
MQRKPSGRRCMLVMLWRGVGREDEQVGRRRCNRVGNLVRWTRLVTATLVKLPTNADSPFPCAALASSLPLLPPPPKPPTNYHS